VLHHIVPNIGVLYSMGTLPRNSWTHYTDYWFVN